MGPFDLGPFVFVLGPFELVLGPFRLQKCQITVELVGPLETRGSADSRWSEPKEALGGMQLTGLGRDIMMLSCQLSDYQSEQSHPP